MGLFVCLFVCWVICFQVASILAAYLVSKSTLLDLLFDLVTSCFGPAAQCSCTVHSLSRVYDTPCARVVL